ncbi:hypothetical protein FF011L_34480 [Roseimaritima multifibrata]|uniref:Uncharacterized protein n=1 Tax=Roseimaritima multifibrata TaxID=1930274 RepID=A0A517MIJ1_9BACT|nr:hypothetical protein FF011L_34480 [Roseimaritima multifibrata]
MAVWGDFTEKVCGAGGLIVVAILELGGSGEVRWSVND